MIIHGKITNFRNGYTVVISEGVTSIADRASSNTGVRKAVIASTVKRIDEYAFSECYLLEEIIIPEGVEEVGAMAYYACPVSSIKIPSTLKVIEGGAFWIYGETEDGSPVELHIPSVEMWVNVSIVDGNVYTNPMAKAQRVYIGGKVVTDIVIPEGITVGKNSCIFGVTTEADYTDKCLASGKTLIKAGEEK